MSHIFDCSRLILESLDVRRHELTREIVKPLLPVKVAHSGLVAVAEKIRAARARKASVVLMMGAHVLRVGVQRYLIDMLERHELSCISMNGAGVIHDYELALIGATTENVADYIRDGRFGMWRETGRINQMVKRASAEGIGQGEMVGRLIEEERFPHRDISLLAAAYRAGIPVTVHVGIGQDILHQHPDFDAAAYGHTSGIDFLRFAGVLENLEHGVVMNFGSAVMAPEVFLKALSMVRNIARQQGRSVSRFTTLVCDLLDLPENFQQVPERGSAAYYFRPWKTMLVRTVADGGSSYYVRGSHDQTVPQLWSALRSMVGDPPR